MTIKSIKSKQDIDNAHKRADELWSTAALLKVTNLSHLHS